MAGQDVTPANFEFKKDKKSKIPSQSSVQSFKSKFYIPISFYDFTRCII